MQPQGTGLQAHPCECWGSSQVISEPLIPTDTFLDLNVKCIRSLVTSTLHPICLQLHPLNTKQQASRRLSHQCGHCGPGQQLTVAVPWVPWRLEGQGHPSSASARGLGAHRPHLAWCPPPRSPGASGQPQRKRLPPCPPPCADRVCGHSPGEPRNSFLCAHHGTHRPRGHSQNHPPCLPRLRAESLSPQPGTKFTSL